jgi:hypothetical protein
VLGELARKTQVLFFTHHLHLLEIARETLGSSLSSATLDPANPSRLQALPARNRGAGSGKGGTGKSPVPFRVTFIGTSPMVGEEGRPAGSDPKVPVPVEHLEGIRAPAGGRDGGLVGSRRP